MASLAGGKQTENIITLVGVQQLHLLYRCCKPQGTSCTGDCSRHQALSVNTDNITLMFFTSKTGQSVGHDAETIISLCEKIIQQHTSLGPASPLSTSMIAGLSSRISSAKEKHSEGTKYKKLMEAAWQERDLYLVNGGKDVMSDLKAIRATLDDQNVNASSWGL